MSKSKQHQTGHIFQKGSSWFLRFRQYELDANGNERLVQRCRKLADNAGKYRSKRAVQTLADEFLAPLNTGAVTSASTMSVVEFWEKQYQPYFEAQLRPSTINGYMDMWGRYLKDRMGAPIRDFKTVDCERLLQSVALEHDLSSTTLKHIKSLMSGLFRYALRMGVLNGVNPVQAVCIPKARPPRETHAYNLQTIHAILKVLPPIAKAVIAIASFTGLRKGELRALRPGDYDGCSLKVKLAAWRRHVNTPKGKRGVGVVPLIPTAAQVLDAYLEAVQPKNYIFETMHGGPGDIEGMVREVIKPAVINAGLPWYGLHAFRRGLATNLHELGIADIVIQAILRHSDVSVTRMSYIKNDSADSRSLAAMEALENEVCNQCATGPNDMGNGDAVDYSI